MSKRRNPATRSPVNPAPSPVFSKRWQPLVRLGLAVFVPALFLLVLELVLRLSGFGYPASFVVRSPDGQHWLPNWRFGWQFFSRELSINPYPFRIPVKKARGALRIFVLGESAAQGTPDPSFGFARQLEFMLRQQFPERQIEIYNAAMRGIDSHVIRLIAQDCVRCEPDLFLVYLGNNEAIGLHAALPGSLRFEVPIGLMRFGQIIKSSRVGQLLKGTMRAVGKTKEKTTQDMDYFRKNRMCADDPRRAATYNYFRANLEDICAVARNDRVKVLVSTVAVNLQDFPPLGSLHRAGVSQAWDVLYQEGSAAEAAGQYDRALDKYLEAARLDDHFAELRFRLGRCYAASKQLQKAAEHFQAACDWDALHFRSDRRLNEIIRQSCSGKTNHGILLVDAEKAFIEKSMAENSLPGSRFFNDHVHFSFEGDYLLARTLLPAIASALNFSSSNRLEFPTRQECADALAFTDWDALNVSAAMIKALNKPPFLDQLEHDSRQMRAQQTLDQNLKQFSQDQVQKAGAVYQRALKARPNEWQLHHTLASFYVDMNLRPAALEEMRRAHKLFPESLPLKVELAYLLQSLGQTSEAIEVFKEVLRICPGFPAARDTLAQMGGN